MAVRQAAAGHVHEDHAVVRRERGELGRQRLRHDGVHLLLLSRQRVDQLGGDGVVAGQDQGPRLALHDRVGVRPVVLAERVPRRLDHHPERVEAGLGRRDLKDEAQMPDWAPGCCVAASSPFTSTA